MTHSSELSLGDSSSVLLCLGQSLLELGNFRVEFRLLRPQGCSCLGACLGEGRGVTLLLFLGLSLHFFELACRELLVSHLLADASLLLLLFLKLLLVLVGKVELLKFQSEKARGDCAFLHGDERVDRFVRLLDPGLHDIDVVVPHSHHGGVAFAIERAQHELWCLVDLLSPFGK